MTVLDPSILVGQRVREARARAGLTQAELARRLGRELGGSCPASSIGRIEVGMRSPSLKTLFILARILGTTASALVSEHPDS